MEEREENEEVDDEDGEEEEEEAPRPRPPLSLLLAPPHVFLASLALGWSRMSSVAVRYFSSSVQGLLTSRFCWLEPPLVLPFQGLSVCARWKNRKVFSLLTVSAVQLLQLSEMFTSLFCIEIRARERLKEQLRQLSGTQWWECGPPVILIAQASKHHHATRYMYHVLRESSFAVLQKWMT